MKLLVVFFATTILLPFCTSLTSSACSSLGELICEENKALRVCIHNHYEYELQPLCKQAAKYVAQCKDGQCGNFPIQEISEGSYNA